MKHPTSDDYRPTWDSLHEILDAAELGAYLGMPTSTIRTLAQQGRIPSFMIGRRRKFHREVIQDWLEKLSTASTAPPQPQPAPSSLHNVAAPSIPPQRGGARTRRTR